MSTEILVLLTLTLSAAAYFALRSHTASKPLGSEPPLRIPNLPAAERVMKSSQPFEMAVDDVFSITGRGTVVTGVISKGTVNVGDKVIIKRINGEQKMTTVTGIESFRNMLTEAEAGANVGLLLSGIEKEDVAQGDKLRETQF